MHRKHDVQAFSKHRQKHRRAMFLSEHRLNIPSLRNGKHPIVKNIPSLRKVKIPQPYIKFWKTTRPAPPPCVAAKTTDFDDDVLCPVKYLCFACQTKSMLFVPISLFLSLSLSLSFSLLCALSKTLVLPKLWGRKLVGEGANTFFWKISTPIFQFNHPQTVLTDRTLQVKSNCQNVKGQKNQMPCNWGKEVPQL